MQKGQPREGEEVKAPSGWARSQQGESVLGRGLPCNFQKNEREKRDMRGKSGEIPLKPKPGLTRFPATLCKRGTACAPFVKERRMELYRTHKSAAGMATVGQPRSSFA